MPDLTPYQQFMGWGGPGQPATWEQGMFGPTGSPTGEGATPTQLAQTQPAYLQGAPPIGQQAGTPTMPPPPQQNMNPLIMQLLGLGGMGGMGMGGLGGGAASNQPAAASMPLGMMPLPNASGIGNPLPNAMGNLPNASGIPLARQPPPQGFNQAPNAAGIGQQAPGQMSPIMMMLLRYYLGQQGGGNVGGFSQGGNGMTIGDLLMGGAQRQYPGWGY